MTDRGDISTASKPGLAPGFFFAALLAACGPADDRAAGRPAQLSQVASIDAGELDEISGIAQSRRDAGLLWVHTDSGSAAELHAVDVAGVTRMSVRLRGARNVDWEDIAAFDDGGAAALVIADSGDNEAHRDHISLYVVAEPALSDGATQTVDVLRRIDVRFADGPRDIESIAVDARRERALLLSKRDLPPRLYAVPLTAAHATMIETDAILSLASLPPPSRADVELARQRDSWHWQPTAMDIAPDGSALAILTYSAVYYYERLADEEWTDALRRAPLRFRLGDIRDAEALAFGADARSLYLTVERRRAPLYRIEFLESEPDAQ